MDQSLYIATLATDDLEPARRASIIRLCVAAHENAEFENLFSYIPSGGRHFLALRGGHLVGHAVVTTRWLQPEGKALLKTAYVDAVATSPDEQGRGHGSALMRALAGGIDDYAIACLETVRSSFYARLGWELWRGPLAGRSGKELIPTPDQQGVMILRLARTPPLDLDEGLSIECQETRIW